MVTQVGDGRQRGANPGVVCHRAIVERCIEVHPNERPLPLELGSVKLVQGELHNCDPMCLSKSTQRAE